ncbi:hypothetical protein TNCV_3280651 [Trichonephila clavipes]|nr:hypothetical protein TNCV_3280651 [Trichonephila clavipes]
MRRWREPLAEKRGHNNCQPRAENDSICRPSSPDIEALTASPGSVRTPEKDRSVGFGSREHPHHSHISAELPALCTLRCVCTRTFPFPIFPGEMPTPS